MLAYCCRQSACDRCRAYNGLRECETDRKLRSLNHLAHRAGSGDSKSKSREVKMVKECEALDFSEQMRRKNETSYYRNP